MEVADGVGTPGEDLQPGEAAAFASIVDTVYDEGDFGDAFQVKE